MKIVSTLNEDITLVNDINNTGLMYARPINSSSSTNELISKSKENQDISQDDGSLPKELFKDSVEIEQNSPITRTNNTTTIAKIKNQEPDSQVAHSPSACCILS